MAGLKSLKKSFRNATKNISKATKKTAQFVAPLVTGARNLAVKTMDNAGKLEDNAVGFTDLLNNPAFKYGAMALAALIIYRQLA